MAAVRPIWPVRILVCSVEVPAAAHDVLVVPTTQQMERGPEKGDGLTGPHSSEVFAPLPDPAISATGVKGDAGAASPELRHEIIRIYFYILINNN